MTSVPAARPEVLVDDDRLVEWRATQKDLWVARRDGRHLGTVELGHRFLATDADGEPIGTYRTLEAARSAVMKQCSLKQRQQRRYRSWWPLAFVGTVSAAAAAMLGAYWLVLL